MRTAKKRFWKARKRILGFVLRQHQEEVARMSFGKPGTLVRGHIFGQNQDQNTFSHAPSKCIMPTFKISYLVVGRVERIGLHYWSEPQKKKSNTFWEAKKNHTDYRSIGPVKEIALDFDSETPSNQKNAYWGIFLVKPESSGFLLTVKKTCKILQ